MTGRTASAQKPQLVIGDKVVIGWMTVDSVVMGNFFEQSILVMREHGAMAALKSVYHGELNFVLHGFVGPAVYLAAAGVGAAYWIYMKNPQLATDIKGKVEPLYKLLDQKYYFDRFNEIVFAGGSRVIGTLLWRIGDAILIDGLVVNGSARLVGWFSGVIRVVQTGYLNHYAFAMISGLILLLGWVILA